MSYGFIILRHVNNQITDKYWKLSYECIRKFYPENKIIIIDDNSNYNFINSEYEKKLYNTKIIKSEYPGGGEIFLFYYFLKNKFFDNAIILHDSTFINKKLDFTIDTYKFLWYFSMNTEQEKIGPLNHNIFSKIKKMNNNECLIEFGKKYDLWNGCFGAMSIINYNFLKKIDEKHNLSKLLHVCKNRYDRMCFERIIGLLCQYYDNVEKEKLICKNLLGNINDYRKRGRCKNIAWRWVHVKRLMNENDPIIKIWSSR